MAQQRRLTRKDAERSGRRAEIIAGLWLRLKGYSVICRRFRCPQGEIDLIVRRGRILCFVEVKARADHCAALSAVTAAAEARICRAATIWASRQHKRADLDWRFDVVTVATGRPRHHKDAFRPASNQRTVNQGDLF